MSEFRAVWPWRHSRRPREAVSAATLRGARQVDASVKASRAFSNRYRTTVRPATARRTDALRACRAHFCLRFISMSRPTPRSAPSSLPTMPTATASTVASRPATPAAQPPPPPIAARATTTRRPRSGGSIATRSPARCRRAAAAKAPLQRVRRDRVLALAALQLIRLADAIATAVAHRSVFRHLSDLRVAAANAPGLALRPGAADDDQFQSGPERQN